MKQRGVEKRCRTCRVIPYYIANTQRLKWKEKKATFDFHTAYDKRLQSHINTHKQQQTKSLLCHIGLWTGSTWFSPEPIHSDPWNCEARTLQKEWKAKKKRLDFYVGLAFFTHLYKATELSILKWIFFCFLSNNIGQFYFLLFFFFPLVKLTQNFCKAPRRGGVGILFPSK